MGEQSEHLYSVSGSARPGRAAGGARVPARSVYSRTVSLRPNPPRMVTVLTAIALVVIGLSLTLVPIGPLNEFLAEYVNPTLSGYGFTLDRQLGYICLAAGPTLLVIGSLLPGI